MTDFKLYLQLDQDNNFVWADDPKSMKSFKDEAIPKGPSRLDFNVASGETFKIKLGRSLKSTWRFDNREISKKRKCPIKVKNYRHPEDGVRQSGECSFEYTVRKKSITITNFDSDIKPGSTGAIESFEFDMYLENFSKDEEGKKVLITKVIIDPIIKNDGTNGPGTGN